MLNKVLFIFHGQFISGLKQYSKARKGEEDRMAKYLQTVGDLVTDAY